MQGRGEHPVSGCADLSQGKCIYTDRKKVWGEEKGSTREMWRHWRSTPGKKKRLTEVHTSAITDHTIDCERPGRKVPRKRHRLDCQRCKGGSGNQEPTPWTGMGGATNYHCTRTWWWTGEDYVAIYKRCSTSAFMMQIKSLARFNLQVLTFKFSVLKQRISNILL